MVRAARGIIAASSPTPLILPSLIAIHVACGDAGSIVRMSPPNSTRSASKLGVRGAWGAPQLISKTHSEIDLNVTGFETIPKIEAKKGQHDLSQIQARAEADRVLESGPEAIARELRAQQVIAIGIARGQKRRVRRVQEPEAAHRQAVDREHRQRVFD